MNKLKSLEEDGTLGLAESRLEVAALAGYSTDGALNCARAMAWINSQIEKKYIIETVFDRDEKTGRVVYKYCMSNRKPNFSHSNRRNKRNRRRTRRQTATTPPTILPTILPLTQLQTAPVATTVDDAPTTVDDTPTKTNEAIKIKLVRGDTTMEVELQDVEQVQKLFACVTKS